MSATEIAAVVVTCVAAGIAGALLVLLVQVRRMLRDARHALEEARADTLVMIETLRVTTRRAELELDRIDALYANAEALSERADSASRLAYRTVTSPVVKAMALGTGTRRAIRRLRSERS